MLSNKVSFTTGEVASICNVNYRTVLRWIERDWLKSYKLPGKRGDNRITRDDLMTFIETQNMPIPETLKINTEPKVLIIDDDENFVRSISRVLKSSGFEVRKATDGFFAGMVLETFKPDLITLDLRMTGMDGLYVINFLKEDQNFINTKILVISALDEKELKNAVARGADAYLQKPFENKELLKSIKSTLSTGL